MESHVDQKNIIPDVFRHDVWSVGISEDHQTKHVYILKHILHKSPRCCCKMSTTLRYESVCLRIKGNLHKSHQTCIGQKL